jgi:hypothetical protein
MIQFAELYLRPALIVLVALGALAFFRAGSGPTSVAAENRISLDAGIKARLKALPPLRGRGVSADAFDSRPVLVTFFASW